MKKFLRYAIAAAGLFLCTICLSPSGNTSAKEIQYNVTSYGVKGNGTTNDTDAINDLLEKAADLSSGDTLVLYFPNGKYAIDDWLRIYSNTTLKLADKAEIFRSKIQYPLMMNVGSDGTRMENSPAGGGYNLSKNIKIIGGTLNGGNISKAKESGNLINFAHAQNITFDGVTIKNCYGAHLIELSGVKNASIKNCDFSGFRTKKELETSLNEDKNLNKTGYAAKECIQLDYTYNHSTKKTFQWCPGYWSDKTACQNITIENNSFHDYPRGVGNHHGRETFSNLWTQNIIIRNNTFKNMYVMTPTGKKLYENAILLHSFKNAVVEGNTIENAGTGVLLVYDSGSAIRNNVMTNLQSTAIVAAKTSAGSTVTGNVLTDIPRYGISVTGTANVKSFANNILKKGAQGKKMINGITVSGPAAYITTVSGNKISGCTQFGISLLNVKKVKNVVSNQFASCKKAAICVSKSNCTSIMNNIIKGVKKSNSVLVAHKSKVKKLSGNTITNSGKNALSIGNGSQVSSVSKNIITNAAGNGICVFAKAKAGNITGNKITGTRIGISILNSRCNKVLKNTVNKSKKIGICSTTATVNFIQKNKITSAKKAGIVCCKKSKGKKISGNKFKKIKGRKIAVDATSRIKKK